MLRRTTRGPVLQLKVSTPRRRESTVVRMGGKLAEDIFRVIVDSLKRYDYVAGESGGDSRYRKVDLKREIGPVVGGFMVLIRRSRRPMEWAPYFEGFLKQDPYRGAHKLLEAAFASAYALSQDYPPHERARMQLHPKVLDAVSSGFKVVIRKLYGIGGRSRR